MATPTALELLREAMAAARANDKPRTRQLLLEATRLDATNETAWQWLAEVAADHLEAATAYEKVLALNPTNQKARDALRPIRLKAGIAAAKGKDIPTARRLLRAVVADDPNSEHGWLWMASVCDSPFEALAHLQKVLTINPNNGAAKKGIDYYHGKLKKAGVESPPASGPVATPPPRVGSSGPVRGAFRSTPTGLANDRRAAGKRVLVVDASRTIRKLVGITLAMDGYTSTEAADALEAADLLREEGIPDLIVLDAHAPGADPYEFCQIIRQNLNATRVRIVLLTGKDGVFDKVRGRMAGIDTFLPKPLQPELLLHTARTYAAAEMAPTA